MQQKICGICNVKVYIIKCTSPKDYTTLISLIKHMRRVEKRGLQQQWYYARIDCLIGGDRARARIYNNSFFYKKLQLHAHE